MGKTFLCIASALILSASAPLPARACSDVALVLAVDGSSSIDDEEFAFQKAAISSAFRDSAVIWALQEAGVVAVSAVFWGDALAPSQKIGWFTIADGEGAEAFARQIEGTHRFVFGDTGIGNGIWTALTMLSHPDLCPRTSIIDVSGDGVETAGPRRSGEISLHRARERAKQMGVRINALVISDDKGGLADYYADQVILGPNAFVSAVRSYADYSIALRKKLIRELASDDRWREAHAIAE